MGEYSEAAVEVLDILNNTNEYYLRKIPASFIKYLSRISSKTYKSTLDHTKSLEELELKEKTKELIGFIYITWWCKDSEKNKYMQMIRENKRKNLNELNESKEPKIVFGYIENSQNKSIEKLNLIEYEKVSPFERFFSKLFNLFKK